MFDMFLHNFVTQCQNKVEFELCFILSFICALDLLPYNILPPCNDVINSIHILTPTLTQTSLGLVT